MGWGVLLEVCVEGVAHADVAAVVDVKGRFDEGVGSD